MSSKKEGVNKEVIDREGEEEKKRIKGEDE